MHTNDKVSFVTLTFAGSGDNKLDIIGDVTSLPAQDDADVVPASKDLFEPFNWILVVSLAVIITIIIIKLVKQSKTIT